MTFGIEMHRARPFIENLRNDPRTKAMVTGWIAQATHLAEQRSCGDGSDYRRMAHDAAQEALTLALAFILDSDGEYRMVCEERDRFRDQVLSTTFFKPPVLIAEGALS